MSTNEDNLEPVDQLDPSGPEASVAHEIPIDPAAKETVDKKVEDTRGDALDIPKQIEVDENAGRAISRLENGRNQNPNVRIERTSADSPEFTVVTLDDKGKEIKREKFTVERPETPDDESFKQAYALMQREFGAEELDPEEIMGEQMKGLRYGYPTGGQARIFAIKNEKGEVVCTLDGALLPLRENDGKSGKDAIYFISYVATEKAVRQLGVAREALISAYAFAQKEAQERGLKFIGGAGECTWRSRNFWEKDGLKRVYVDEGSGKPLREVRYVQPPLDISRETGKVEEGAGPAPEHFMIDSFDNNEDLDNAAIQTRLSQVVNAFNYSQSYIDRQAFTDAHPNDESAAEAAFAEHRVSVDPHADKFKKDVTRGTVLLLSSEEVKAYRSRGKTIKEYFPGGTAERQHVKKKLAIESGNF